MEQAGWRLRVKRAIDVVGASASLALLWPIFVGAGAAILGTMGRPILFKQQRPGYKGRPFCIYKFRTMRPPTEREVWFNTDGDRLTRLGAFLRKTSIDELPELFNVLKGEMSLVGPRPLLMEYLEKYTPTEARRHDVLPGLTGWAQVNGRNRPKLSERRTMDVWYVDNWSLSLDMRILVKTIKLVLSTEGVIPAAKMSNVDDRGFQSVLNKAHKELSRRDGLNS